MENVKNFSKKKSFKRKSTSQRIVFTTAFILLSLYCLIKTNITKITKTPIVLREILFSTIVLRVNSIL